MPAPTRTSLPAIVAAASALLESEGLDRLTMLAVARRVGVQAPSLYKHVADRAELIRLVATDATLELARDLEAAAADGEARDPRRARLQVLRMADALRACATRRPQAIALVFRPPSEDGRVRDEDLARSAEPILAAVAAVAGRERALDAARALTALAWGFVSMELSGAFRLGGDVESAWRFATERLVDAIASPDPDASA